MTTAQNYFKSSRGFTLIELMIVIVIIAVLATIGITVYSTIQASARNTARKSDINAIAKALETNRTAAFYVALSDSHFASGKLPLTDPTGLTYIYGSPNTVTTPTTVWTAGTPPTGFSSISTSIPGASTTSWKICTWLEAQGTTAAVAYCRTNQQ